MTEPAATRTVLMDQDLPEALHTAHVEIRRITLPPGIATGSHMHNGPVFGSIERGTVTFQITDGPEVTLRAGDTFFEPANTVISRFDASAQGAVFLGYFLLAHGQSSLLTPIDA